MKIAQVILVFQLIDFVQSAGDDSGGFLSDATVENVRRSEIAAEGYFSAVRDVFNDVEKRRRKIKTRSKPQTNTVGKIWLTIFSRLTTGWMKIFAAASFTSTNRTKYFEQGKVARITLI